MGKYSWFWLTLILLFLPGCWDATDVKDIFIPFVAGNDYVQENGHDKYILTVNYPVFGQAKEKSDVLEAEGETLGQTRVDRGNKSARMITIGDLRAVVIGTGLARRGTSDLFDLLSRNSQLAYTLRLAVAKGMAKDILDLKPQHYQSVGQNVLDLLKNADKNNFIPCENLYDFMKNAITPGFNPVLPVIRIHSQNKLEIAGAALFKRDRMIAMINTDDMRVLTWLRGEKKAGDILFELKDAQNNINEITFEGQNSRSVKAKMVNGVPHFEVEVKLIGTVVEDINNFPFAGKEQNVKLAEQALEQKVKKQCDSLVNDLQNNYQVDSILLGKLARTKWPELTDRQDWDKSFCRSVIKVKVKAVIQGTGEVA